MNTQKIGQTFMWMLERKAEELRKREPHLTEAQAFTRVYLAPENRELAKAEREANGFRKTYPPVARTEPAVAFGEKDVIAELKKLAAEFRAQNPFLTPEQAFARVYSNPNNRELVRLERKQNRPSAA